MTLEGFLCDFRGLKKENKIYIMIDEYDYFTKGMLQENTKKFLEVLGSYGFIRCFFEIIKANQEIADPPIRQFFATGVVPITLDSLTSGFNIATRVMNNPLYTAMCGLTKEEVKQVIEMAGIKEKEETFNKIKENYGGYRFSTYNETHIFNTALVMYYLKNLIQTGKPPKNLVDGNLSTIESKIHNITKLIDKEQSYEILNKLLVDDEKKEI